MLPVGLDFYGSEWPVTSAEVGATGDTITRKISGVTYAGLVEAT